MANSYQKKKEDDEFIKKEKEKKEKNNMTKNIGLHYTPHCI